MNKHEDQAKRIAATMVRRHEEDGIPYGEMACLFRCTKKAYFGNLTTHLQSELAKRNVPFQVVGANTLFENEAVVDLLSYLRLCTGDDDVSFERILNKPPRLVNCLYPILQNNKQSINLLMI